MQHSLCKRICLASAFSLMVACALLSASEIPRVTAARFQAAPVIDGRTDDPCWAQCPVLELKKVGSLDPPTQRTEARLGYDDHALYVAFRCFEDAADKLVATVKERDGNVYQDDCVEFFLGPHADPAHYYHLLVNAVGTQRDDVGADAAWNAKWQSAVARDDSGWSVEIALPFDQLMLLPDAPAEWGINFCREEQPHGELSTWGPCTGGFHEPGNFGRLVGLKADLKPAMRASLVARSQEVASRGSAVKGQPSAARARGLLSNLAESLRGGNLKSAYALLTEAESAVQRAELEQRWDSLRKASGDPKAAFVVCQENTMVKVRGDRPYDGTPAKSLSLSLARHEYEPVQIVVAPLGNALRNCQVKVAPLSRKGAGLIQPSDVTVNVVGFVKTQTPSGGASEPAGLLPDPLLPDHPVEVPADRPQPFWITVYARPELKAGTYRGTVTVTADGCAAKVLPLSVRVFGFTLPVRPALRTCFLLNPGYVVSRYGLPGPWAWTSNETNYASDVSGVSAASATAASGKFALTGQASPSRYIHFRAPVGGSPKRRLSFDYRFDTQGPLFVLFGGGAEGGKNAFYTPPDQTRGTWHHAECTLSDCGVAGACSIEFVHDNADTHQPHSFFIDNVRVTEGEKILLDEGFEKGLPNDQGQNLLRNFRLNMLAHRISDCNIASPEVKVSDTGKVAMDWSQFDREIEFYREHGLTGFNMNWLRIGAGWGSAETPGTEQARALAAELCQQTQAHLDARGWTDDGYIYTFDEPGPEAMKTIRKAFDFVHQKAPRLKTLLTFGYGATRPWRPDAPEGSEASYASLEGAVDVWVPHIDCADFRVLERQRTRPRNELWHYVCISAQKPYPNLWGIDYRGIDHRILYWQLWRYQLTGTLYWAVTYWQQNLWENPMSYPGGNGDGSLYYWPDGVHASSGSDGKPDTPVNSVRLELTRDGIEDYDYLALLQKASAKAKGADAATARKLLDVSDLTPAFNRYVTDPQRLAARREEIARLVEALNTRR